MPAPRRYRKDPTGNAQQYLRLVIEALDLLNYLPSAQTQLARTVRTEIRALITTTVGLLRARVMVFTKPTRPACFALSTVDCCFRFFLRAVIHSSSCVSALCSLLHARLAIQARGRSGAASRAVSASNTVTAAAAAAAGGVPSSAASALVLMSMSTIGSAWLGDTSTSTNAHVLVELGPKTDPRRLPHFFLHFFLFLALVVNAHSKPVVSRDPIVSHRCSGDAI